MNRGRIQAQGNKTERSEPWAIEMDIDKQEGLDKVKKLEKKLTSSEFKLRKDAFIEVKKRISTAPKNGIDALYKKSYYDDFKKRYIRVDIEVIKGKAFIDKKVIK